MGVFACPRCAAETVHEVEQPEEIRAWDRETTVLVCSECQSPAGFREKIDLDPSRQEQRERVWTMPREARHAGRRKLVERLKLIDQSLAAAVVTAEDVSFRDAAKNRITGGRR